MPATRRRVRVQLPLELQQRLCAVARRENTPVDDLIVRAVREDAKSSRDSQTEAHPLTGVALEDPESTSRPLA